MHLLRPLVGPHKQQPQPARQRANAPARLTRLTAREDEVLQLLVAGLDNAAIAERLKMGTWTHVASRLYHVKKCICVNTWD